MDKKEIIKEYTKSVARGFHNAFILLGGPGLGKTTSVLKTLDEEGVKYSYHNGVSTPLALCSYLELHKDNETLVFDDCNGIVNNSSALSILLSALWGAKGKRIINWNTTKGKVFNFEFKSRIIIITNRMPKTYHSEVVLSRCLNYELKFSYQEVLDFMYSIGDKEIVEYIAQNSSPATRHFDLRLLERATNFKNYDLANWKSLIQTFLDEKDERIELILTKCSDSDWKEQTGLSIRSLQRYKKQLGLSRNYNSPIRQGEKSQGEFKTTKLEVLGLKR